MKPSILFAKAICIQPNELLVIKFANKDEFSGEIILSHDILLLPEKHKERIRKVLRLISDYVTDTKIIKRKCVAPL